MSAKEVKFIPLLMIFLGVLSGIAFPLTPEKAAELAFKDASEKLKIPSSIKLFAGEPKLFPDIIRVQLNYREEGNSGVGSLFAEYEFETATDRIVRRDFSGAFQNRISGLFDLGVPENEFKFSLERETQSLRMGIQGVLRNLPGYILDTPDFLSRFKIWAESNGKVVATETELIGNTVYNLKGVPATVKSVAIKAKIRGYDLLTLHPGVVIDPAQPAGVIAGIDIDFHNLKPIERDIRIIVQSTSSQESPSFPNGARARVYARETGQTVEVISVNGMAEALLQRIPTGWPLRFMAINLDQGFHYGELGPVTIPEDGGTTYTDIILMK
ncbi:hypothetical protein HYY75_13075 [bacterium]|nr:hypothetical protein [bacterium]